MQTPLNISIPFPCHENWDTMTPETQGRHCKACDKVVVDFTNMSDVEILQYIQSKKSSICGRMTNHQLTEHPTLNKKLKLFLYALASVFLLSMNVEAQTDSIKNLPTINLGGDRTSGNYVVDGMIIQSETKTVSGVVIDENGEPLDFATVTISQNGKIIKGQKTNKKGEFYFKEVPNNIYTLKVIYTGYEILKKEINLTKNECSNQKIILFKQDPKNDGVIIKRFRQGLISKDGPIRKIDTIATQEYFVEGIVMDEKGKPLDFANVSIIQNGAVIGGKKTNLEGKFKIPIYQIDNCLIKISYIGYANFEFEFNKSNINKLKKIKLKKGKTIRCGGPTILYKVPLIDPQNPNQKIINKEDMKHMGYR